MLSSSVLDIRIFLRNKSNETHEFNRCKPEERGVCGEDYFVAAERPLTHGGPAHQAEVTELTGALHRRQLPVEIVLVGQILRPGQEDVSFDPEIHDDD